MFTSKFSINNSIRIEDNTVYNLLIHDWTYTVINEKLRVSVKFKVFDNDPGNSAVIDQIFSEVQFKKYLIPCLASQLKLESESNELNSDEVLKLFSNHVIQARTKHEFDRELNKTFIRLIFDSRLLEDNS
jgi:hypothetical protein